MELRCEFPKNLVPAIAKAFADLACVISRHPAQGDGILVSTRDPPQLSAKDARTFGEALDVTRTLALAESGSRKRAIFLGTAQQGERREIRRVKAFMKQVVSGIC